MSINNFGQHEVQSLHESNDYTTPPDVNPQPPQRKKFVTSSQGDERGTQKKGKSNWDLCIWKGFSQNQVARKCSRYLYVIRWQSLRFGYNTCLFLRLFKTIVMREALFWYLNLWVLYLNSCYPLCLSSCYMLLYLLAPHRMRPWLKIGYIFVSVLCHHITAWSAICKSIQCVMSVFIHVAYENIWAMPKSTMHIPGYSACDN